MYEVTNYEVLERIDWVSLIKYVYGVCESIQEYLYVNKVLSTKN